MWRGERLETVSEGRCVEKLICREEESNKAAPEKQGDCLKLGELTYLDAMGGGLHWCAFGHCVLHE